MKTSSHPTPVASSGNKPLWVAIGVLSVAVIGLGAVLLYVNTRPTAPQALAVPGGSATPASLIPGGVTPASPADQGHVARDKASPTLPKPAPKTVPSATRSAPAAPVEAVPVAGPQPAAQPARAVCVNCATVTSVTAVEREGAPSGAGAVAGGVLGALVGNQFGGGDGKTAATILGAIGGGVAGNTVEKKMKKETVYQVQLQMDDGSRRSLEQVMPVSVGARVRLEGNTLQPLAPAN